MVMKNALALGLLLPLVLLMACATNAPAAAPQTAGERLFAQHCVACHTTSGDTVIVGPALAGIAGRAEARLAGLDAHAYIEQSILEPSAYISEGFNDLMPKTFGHILSQGELDALVDYLMTLDS